MERAGRLKHEPKPKSPACYRCGKQPCKCVAALCVSARSVYKSMVGVDCYDAKRGAKTFPGGIPVVAHPPCRSWSVKTRHQAKPAAGEQELGIWCCEQLKQWGGVLEQPAGSLLFEAAGLPQPGEARSDGLWTIQCWQAWWGYPMKKTTWLCFSGIESSALPPIPLRLHPRGNDRRAEQRMSKQQRSATTREFAEWLVACARLAANRLNQEVLF